MVTQSKTPWSSRKRYECTPFCPTPSDDWFRWRLSNANSRRGIRPPHGTKMAKVRRRSRAELRSQREAGDFTAASSALPFLAAVIYSRIRRRHHFSCGPLNKMSGCLYESGCSQFSIGWFTSYSVRCFIGNCICTRLAPYPPPVADSNGTFTGVGLVLVFCNYFSRSVHDWANLLRHWQVPKFTSPVVHVAGHSQRGARDRGLGGQNS